MEEIQNSPLFYRFTRPKETLEAKATMNLKTRNSADGIGPKI